MKNPLEAFPLALAVTHKEHGDGRVLGTKELSDAERASKGGGWPRWCVKVRFGAGIRYVGTGTLTRVPKVTPGRQV